MPTKVVHRSVSVYRSGSVVRLKPAAPGKPAVTYNFTDDEVRQITRVNPRAIRNPMIEGVPALPEGPQLADEDNGGAVDPNAAPGTTGPGVKRNGKAAKDPTDGL